MPNLTISAFTFNSQLINGHYQQHSNRELMSRRKRPRTPTPGHYLGLKSTRDTGYHGDRGRYRGGGHGRDDYGYRRSPRRSPYRGSRDFSPRHSPYGGRSRRERSRSRYYSPYKLHEFAQSQLFEYRAQSEEDRAAKQLEVNLLIDEVERAQSRLYSLEREKDRRTRVPVAKVYHRKKQSQNESELSRIQMDEHKGLVDRFAEQMDKIKSLKALVEKCQKKSQELQIVLEMHGQEHFSNRYYWVDNYFI
ncbi:hypothetical protein FRX31_015897 [Thalictrum thalictroides]|uniref:Uncharacterized protein n=1 Tax=Thalictrum thalictroides TaxID=46969 RepID=A0A7J6WCD4_THATH|nr:hypothetical protein FRX31_015897 [Thalictrum thalictroides]